MREILDTIARELGLTIRFAVPLALAIAALAAAQIWNVDLLYGVAVVVALIAGTEWNREIRCDACGESLEESEVAER